MLLPWLFDEVGRPHHLFQESKLLEPGGEPLELGFEAVVFHGFFDALELIDREVNGADFAARICNIEELVDSVKVTVFADGPAGFDNTVVFFLRLLTNLD
uniref:Uncharacterized protein n=1 Tax=Euplotes harpa TaxID=151035 RepID=A0A7S3NBX4_9SPIT